jgi:hypothetical protein
VRIEGALAWSGLTGSVTDVYRDGVLITTTENDGAYTDTMPRGTRGLLEYQLFEAGTQVCPSPTRQELT